MRSSASKYYQGSQMKEGDTGGACSTHRINEKWLENVGRKTWKNHSEDLGIDGS
jgi:hypothetical protein